MNFAPIDLISFVGFFAVVIGLSVWKSRRAKDHAENSADFFLAGRGLTWPLIGFSIVAANISTEQMVGMAGQAAGGVGLAASAVLLFILDSEPEAAPVATAFVGPGELGVAVHARF